MNREQIFQLQKDYADKGWHLELNVNRFFDTNGKEVQNYIFFDGCVATLSKDDIECYLMSCGERKFTYNDSYYRHVEDIGIYNDEELAKANIEFIDNGWYELQIFKGMDFLSEGDDVGHDDTFSNIDNVEETIAFIMEHIKED